MGESYSHGVVPEDQKNYVTVNGLACDECGRTQCSSYASGHDCPKVRCDGTLVRFKTTVEL